MTKEKSNTVKDEDKLMLVFSYLGILCLIPFFAVKQDNEYVRWHAKQGLILFIAEIILIVPLGIISAILDRILILYLFFSFFWFLIWVVVIVLVIYSIIQALRGIKWKIPLISDFAEKL